MRVSITDRCNLRCKYCMPEDLPFVAHEDILRYEEILRICKAAVKNGVKNFKVTGGEPLARRGCVDFISRLKELPGVERVTLTTNGVLLEQYLDGLAAIGIDGVNISLDTLDPLKYFELTGFDGLDKVMGSLLRAVEMGIPVKLNCVPLRDFNGGEYSKLAKLAKDYPLDIRFIEAMPIGGGVRFEPVPGGEIFTLLKSEYPDLRESTEKRGCGPARYYSSDKLQGSIGFINAVSHSFCGNCNRVRLTSEGFLKLCLYHETGVDFRALIRGGADDNKLSEEFEAAIAAKPEKHSFITGERPAEQKEMWRIGG